MFGLSGIRFRALVVSTVLGLFAAGPAGAGQTPSTLDDPDFFPIGVWLQGPHNAERYKAIGINTYVGLWDGPTAEQLASLKKVGLFVVADQNDVALASPDNDIIVAWMQQDEPDNAQPLPLNLGYGQPVPPGEVVARYEAMKARDATRPIFMNLGQGVAWDGWHGRGSRSGHQEDYPLYLRGADIVSFDIYPAVHWSAEVAGRLEMVAHGVERLRGWAAPGQIVWNCIEASRIGNLERKPTPHEIRAEVWMSLIHGSRGLIYFVHQFEPNFVEASLLEDDELSAAVAAINEQVRDLAPVLNSPTVEGAVETGTDPASAPIAVMAKSHEGALYVFAVAMNDRPASATFTLAGKGPTSAKTLGEERSIEISTEGSFTDSFEPYGVHLYRIE